MPGEMVQVASSTRLVPNVCALYAEGDTVIALFDAERMVRDGKPYRNTYSWYVQMRDGGGLSPDTRSLLRSSHQLPPALSISLSTNHADPPLSRVHARVTPVTKVRKIAIRP